MGNHNEIWLHTCACWNLGCKMDFPGLWFGSKQANYLIWLGPEQTHTLSKTLLFKLALNYLNQPAEAQPHFHQAMLRKTVPHAAHCFCWQWTCSWHIKYNFTNSYYRAEQLLYITRWIWNSLPSKWKIQC